ncbi:MAG: hypothetical protein Q7T79_01490 [bacterium]|nr:hypothetical protein [bacterium]
MRKEIVLLLKTFVMIAAIVFTSIFIFYILIATICGLFLGGDFVGSLIFFIPLLFIVLIVDFSLFRMMFKKGTSSQSLSSLQVALKDYVAEASKRGLSRDAIIGELELHGWKKQEIEEAFLNFFKKTN